MKKVISFVLVLVLCCNLFNAMVVNVVAGDNSGLLYADEEKELTISRKYEAQYCTFIPEESGWYKYYSSSKIGVGGAVYKSEGHELLGESDNYYKDFIGQMALSGDFEVVCYLTQGVQYTLSSFLSYYVESGTYNVGITKLPPATDMKLTSSEIYSAYLGYHREIPIIFTPEDCEPENITWEVADPSIVEIDEDGICFFKNVGTTTVTATTDRGFTDSVEVQVGICNEIKEGEEITDFTGLDSTHQYTFVPERDGSYMFNVDINEWRIHAKASIYDKDYNLLAEDMDIPNVSINANMYAGEYYYLVYTGISDDIGAEGTVIVKRVGNTVNTDEDPDGIDRTDDLLQDGEEMILDKMTEISLAEEKEVGITFKGAKSVYRFTPAEDGEYKFYAYGDPTVCINILDNDFESLAAGTNNATVRLEAGQTYIFRSYISGVSAYQLDTYKVQIKKLPKADKIIISNGDVIRGNIGYQEILNVEYDPIECESEKIKWETSDKNIVDIDSGIIHMKSVGSAVITVSTESGLTDSINIEVVHHPEIKVDETIAITEEVKEKVFTFIPEKSGHYIFSVASPDINLIMSVDISEVDGENVYSVKGKNNLNTNILLRAGKVYYITLESLSGDLLNKTDVIINLDTIVYDIGDVNMDGTINASDALDVLKYAAKLSDFNENQSELADVNSDETINADDALEVLRIAARLK